MKRIRFNRLLNSVRFLRSFAELAVFASATVCSIATLSAQTDSLVSAAPTALPAPSHVITFASGQASRSHSAEGRFASVALNPLETAAIKLQFATTLADTPIIVQPLDGGTLGLTDESAAVTADRTISFQLQAGASPRLYRVLVTAGGTVSMVQFSVPLPTSGQ
jgi:hypothetical protein